MAQIAQQDNLIIKITESLDEMNETTKQKLIGCIEAGTITDVIIVSTEAANKVNYGKVLSYRVDTTAAGSPKYTVALVEVDAGKLVEIRLN